MGWALLDSPVINAEERLILVALADTADADGRGAWPSHDTLAERALVASRTVRRRLDALESRGVIARGDQSRVSYLRPDHRPVVWDLMIPFSYFRNLERLEKACAKVGTVMLTAADRPDLPPAPERTRRADTKPARPHGGTCSPPGLGVPPDSESTTGGLVVHDGGTCSPTNLSLNLPLEPLQPATQVVAAVVAIRGKSVAVYDDPKARALAVAQRWWEGLGQKKPIGRGAWHSLLAVCEAGIKGGHSQQAVYDALLAVGAVPTIDRMDRILRGVASQAGQSKPSTTDQRIADGMKVVRRLREAGL